jgi:sugar-phosphatase
MGSGSVNTVGVDRALGAVSAVLFDMDGTLVDSDAAVERSWRAWAGEQGLDPDEVASLAQGPPAAVTIARLRPGWTADQVGAAAEAQLERECRDTDDTAPTTGAHEMLGVVARLGLPWAVVTSANTALARIRLGLAGIHPSCLITADDVPVGKPDPAGYRLAAGHLGVEPARCLVVEDTEAGVAAGRAAGALVASVKNTPSDLLVADLGELGGRLADAHAGLPGVTR